MVIVSDKGFHRPDFSLAIKSVNNDISKLSTKKSHTNPVHLIMTIIISTTINLTHVNYKMAKKNNTDFDSGQGKLMDG